MKKLNNSFEYKFKKNLTYIKDGKPGAIAKKITVKAPTRNNLNNCVVLEQQYRKAEIAQATNLVGAVGKEYYDKLTSDKKSEKEKEESTPEAIIDVLMSTDADILKCFTVLKYILLSGTKDDPVALIDDTVLFEEAIYNDIDYVDLKGLLGNYIQVFFVSSQTS